MRDPQNHGQLAAIPQDPKTLFPLIPTTYGIPRNKLLTSRHGMFKLESAAQRKPQHRGKRK
jgi:hypothetical protein